MPDRDDQRVAEVGRRCRPAQARAKAPKENVVGSPIFEFVPVGLRAERACDHEEQREDRRERRAGQPADERPALRSAPRAAPRPRRPRSRRSCSSLPPASGARIWKNPKHQDHRVSPRPIAEA